MRRSILLITPMETLATGLEALRDITTPAFMRARGFVGNDERKYRENAEAFFIHIAHMLEKKASEERSPLENCVCNLGMKLNHYKDIRNIFAHSLSKLTDSDIEKIRNDIDQFEQMLHLLKKEYDSNKRDFEALFKMQQISSKTGKTSRDCRVIIDFSGDCDYNSYKKSMSGKTYDVFYLETDVWKKIIGGVKGKTYKTTQKAYFLLKYLKRYMPIGYDMISIVLYKCPDVEKEMIFRAFMENLTSPDSKLKIEYTEKGNVKSFKKMGLRLLLENYEQRLSDNEAEYVTVMSTNLKQA